MHTSAAEQSLEPAQGSPVDCRQEARKNFPIWKPELPHLIWLRHGHAFMRGGVLPNGNTRVDPAKEESLRELEETPMERKFSEEHKIRIRIDSKESCFSQDTRTDHSECSIAHVDVPQV